MNRYSRLSIKSCDIRHNGPRGEDTVDRGFVVVAFKQAVNSVLIPRSAVSNFATFDRQLSICSLSPHPVLGLCQMIVSDLVLLY